MFLSFIKILQNVRKPSSIFAYLTASGIADQTLKDGIQTVAKVAAAASPVVGLVKYLKMSESSEIRKISDDSEHAQEPPHSTNRLDCVQTHERSEYV